jgi:UDP-glucose 4-epimerase
VATQDRDSTPRRVLVTGGAGFIGSHLVDELLRRGHVVTVYDNLSLGRRELLDAALAAGARLIVADLLDLDRLCEAMTGQEMIWHLAASSDIRAGTRSTRIDLEQGTLVTYNVLEAMRRCGVPRLAFASSSVVYGEPTRVPTAEDYGPLLPISLYGAAKLAAEGLITAFAHCFTRQVYIFRFANIVGRRATHGILHDLAAKLRASPDELEVLGDGRQRKSYLAVDDCVSAMLFVVDHGPDAVNLYNLGGGDNVTVARIAELVVERWSGGRARLRFTGGARGWPGDVPTMLLDPGRLARLGWRASCSSEQAVERAIEELRDELLPR